MSHMHCFKNLAKITPLFMSLREGVISETGGGVPPKPVGYETSGTDTTQRGGPFSAWKKTAMRFGEDDPRHHTIKIRDMCSDIRDHLREDIGKINEPTAELLFETTAKRAKDVPLLHPPEGPDRVSDRASSLVSMPSRNTASPPSAKAAAHRDSTFRREPVEVAARPINTPPRVGARMPAILAIPLAHPIPVVRISVG